jgi:alpha-mannosidase
MKKAGIDYFVTTKMSWDRYNAYPHHTFLWEGIDGSSVLAHMPPEGTYNSAALPSSIRKAETEFQDKAVSSHALLVYGIGDGGGGPGIEHLERLQREENLEGLPPVRQEPVTRFLERLKGERDLLHTWHGELYLACHQGTYTTQGRNKRYNRLMEVGLRELELSAVLAELLAADPYPAERIEELWKETLLYQFHDILPGSSITRVYKDTGRRYPVLLAESASLTRKAIGELAGRVNTRTAREPALVINPFSWNRREWVRSGDRWLFVEAPPVGYVVIDAASTPHIPPVSAGPFFLENEFLRVTIAEDGSITSVFDREQEREVLAGPGNILTVYHDPGDAWDFAWDYEYRVLGRFGLCSAESAVNGPRGEVTLTFGYGASTLVQTVSLKAGSRVLEFDTRADWQERGAMLRASFAVDVRADEATCGIQFGWIKRPTHRSTSWDASKYEIPAQQWIDLSQRNRGVAILKENKYGHRVAGNMLDIHLLRGPSYPDPEADRGEHEFRYGLFPHPGDHITGGVIRAAAEFNAPLRLASCVAGKGHLPASFSLVTVDAQNVFVEAVKRGEEGKGIIVRLSESWGADVRSKVHFGMAVVSAAVTDLLEENPVPLDVSGDSVTVELRPFDVVTLVVVPRSYPGETGSIPAGV